MPKGLGDLIFSSERVSGEAAGKAESHLPRIEAPEKVRAGEAFEVRVRIGPHPSVAEHYIGWIDVYFEEEGRPFNPLLLARIALAPGYVEPDVRLVLKLRRSGLLHVVGYCNVHGLWEAKREVRVEKSMG